MARLLVVYGTTDGHTARVAEFIGQELEALGHEATIARPDGVEPQPDAYQGVVIAASVHAGKFQSNVSRWARAHARLLETRPSAFVAVCLGILQQDATVQAEVKGIVARFLEGAGWQPSLTVTVAGALRYTRYNWLTRWMMKRMAARAGGDTDTSRDHVYTDWEAVRRFVSAFGRRVADVTAGPPAAVGELRAG